MLIGGDVHALGLSIERCPWQQCCIQYTMPTKSRPNFLV